VISLVLFCNQVDLRTDKCDDKYSPVLFSRGPRKALLYNVLDSCRAKRYERLTALAVLLIFFSILCFGMLLFLALVVSVLCPGCPMLPLYLYCPFLIVPSGFSTVYLNTIHRFVDWMFLNQWHGNLKGKENRKTQL
jgi:fatty acid desaturase